MSARKPVSIRQATALKCPNGFFLVNLSDREQKELRKLARQSGQELRGAVRNAVFQLKEELKIAADVRTKTGMKLFEFHIKVLRSGAGHN